MEITKREVGASVTIIAIMLLIGLLIGNVINNRHIDNVAKYDKAIHITGEEEFAYGMETSVGNAFIYGKLNAVDAVSFEQYDKEFSYVKRVKEHYTRHTRRVKSGKRYRTKVYYTWDMVGSTEKHCGKVIFLGSELPANKFNLEKYSSERKIVNIDHNDRYVFYGTDIEMKGTLFANLSNDISDTYFYKDKTIDETVEKLDKNTWIVIFWIFWILIIIVCVFGFYYLNNDWLNI